MPEHRTHTPLRVRDVLERLANEDPEAIVEIAIWRGDGSSWMQVEAEDIKSQTVLRVGQDEYPVVQFWTPATSSQYGRRKP